MRFPVAPFHKVIHFVGGPKAAQLRAKNPTYIDLKGKTLTLGIIKSHAHLMSLGFSQLNLNLSQASSYQEMIDPVALAVAKAAPVNGYRSPSR